MTTFVWGINVAGFGLSGDWNTASLWAGGIVPNSASAAVLINAPGSYSITIAAGETDIVNTLTLTGGATNLMIDGTLEFAGPLPPSPAPHRRRGGRTSSRLLKNPLIRRGRIGFDS